MTKREEQRATATQRRHLMERIDRSRRAWFETPKPAAVVAAEKVVAAWEKRMQTLNRKRRASWGERIANAREVVLFGSVSDALKAVKKIESIAAGGR